MKAKLLMAGVVLAWSFLAGCADSTFMIHNDSSFDIHEVNLSPTSDRLWGGNLLGARPLLSGDSIEIVDIDCDVYDVRVVDEDGDECVIDSLELCLEDAVWTIDDPELAVCTLFN